MNSIENENRQGELESLPELVGLWRQRQGGYSREFLAATMCAELGRLRRLISGDNADRPSIKTKREEIAEAEKVVRSDPELAELAISYSYAVKFAEEIKQFLEVFQRGSAGDEALADRGMDVLYDYDSLSLMLNELEHSQLSKGSREKLKRERRIIDQAAKTIRRNRMAFYAASLMVNNYCLTWNVEPRSILHEAANLANIETEVLLAELTSPPAIFPQATAECPNEEQIVLAFEGRLGRVDEKLFNAHVAKCAHCPGLLDSLVRTAIRTPDHLPAVPKAALPDALRPQPKISEPWSDRAAAFVRHIIDFIVPRVLPEPILLQAAETMAYGRTLEELENRQNVMEAEKFQVVLFLRQGNLCLSVLADNLQPVTSLSAKEVKSKRKVRLKVIDETASERIYLIGPVASFIRKTLEIGVRFEKQMYLRKVRIRQS